MWICARSKANFVSGQFLLNYGLWFVFTKYAYSVKSIVGNSSYTDKEIMIKLSQMVDLRI